MKHWVRVAETLAACAFLSGCAASLPPAAKKEAPPRLSVRLPVAAASKLDIESQASLGRPELPLSVADESRGRWLTLFEMNYSPAKSPPTLLPVIEEEPSR